MANLVLVGGDVSTPNIWKLYEQLPAEIQEIINIQQKPHFLDTLALAALRPQFTLSLFSRFENVFSDTCARWIKKESEKNRIIGAFAQVLPLAPHLVIFLEKYLGSNHKTCGKIDIFCQCNGTEKQGEPYELQKILLATWRLLNFDKRIFSRMFEGAKIQSLLNHNNLAVRYLAIRVFCQLLSVAEFKCEEMIRKHVGEEQPVLGDFDGEVKDLFFLTLLEEKRLQEATKMVKCQKNITNRLSDFNLNDLSPCVFRCGGILIPRPSGPPSSPSLIAMTVTTSENMEKLAIAYLSKLPILVHGLPGSGKTLLVNEFARELGADSDMVTLHLNDQSDAKMLIGIYTTGKIPGTFIWKPGVLTTAVREGRWVFIEDFDHAPNDVIGVILSLIERGELLIPNRGEIVKAGRGFRLLASIQTSLSLTGYEIPPAIHVIGERLWRRVSVKMPSDQELFEIIDKRFPLLHEFLPGVIDVYSRLQDLMKKSIDRSKTKNIQSRAISTRDLMKWCRRIEGVLVTKGSKTGREPINDTTRYDIFFEATDVFAASLQNLDIRKTLLSQIAETMHIEPRKVDYFINSHVPRYEESSSDLLLGRVLLTKRVKDCKQSKKKRPFSITNSAKRLLEKLGVAVKFTEPILIVGETGIGKTTAVQQLADCLGYKLIVINLSQQSEVGDLLGGYKPVNIRTLSLPLKDEFDELFSLTGLSETKNQKYLEQLRKSCAKGQWTKASKLWREASKMFEQIFSSLLNKSSQISKSESEQPKKRRKIETRLEHLLGLRQRWDRFSKNLDQFDMQVHQGSKGFTFSFIESNLVKAVRNGDWVLLDEINLASPDTLESIVDLLHDGSEEPRSILLSETGEIKRIFANPDFRIFGAMNPATDVGKRDLSPSLRSCFTEIYFDSPDTNLEDLISITNLYLGGNTNNDERIAYDVAMLFLKTKQLAKERTLVDGVNQVPHFSIRTLTRILGFVRDTFPIYGLRRALFEGFAMGFLTLLNQPSEKMLMPLLEQHLLNSKINYKAIFSQPPKYPEDGKIYVPFMNSDHDRHYWLLQGQEPCEVQLHYIRTPSVERNILNLVRAVSTRRYPVLIQGPTSSGKTSMIEYLAKHSGNKCVRINNHEHTDLQEYLGSYISAPDGLLHFHEGVLIQALRQGHWIILDELNLAPTDVLEALNRLLDDNREILIPETQQVVHPHERFMLFATQNPPGHYGGRKMLSRAFRNRFLELHFDDIPEKELETILKTRCQNLAPSDCARIVKVYEELSKLRQSNRLFEHKNSFATLRDLFRWAFRAYDSREQLAANGFMLLAERVRNPEELKGVQMVIEKVMKVKINTTEHLYNTSLSPEIKLYNYLSHSQEIVWTNAMRRLYVLVAHAIRNNEPVLLVGETGCGKTTVCQMLAEAWSKKLYTVNAHQNTETGDLIGAHRPIRNRSLAIENLKKDILTALSYLGRAPIDCDDVDILLETYQSLPEDIVKELPVKLHQNICSSRFKVKALFDWVDGNLIQAMKEGQFFLLDEISLADDAVLERLNSVLEPGRSILLAEKGSENPIVKAADGFQIFATMNPGGDYGKRELSPALRNRFTEIWVPSLSDQEDVFQIVESKLGQKFKIFSKLMIQFAEWFGRQYRQTSQSLILIRDMLTWVKFINKCHSNDIYFCIIHGASMVYIDTLGANPAALLAISPEKIFDERIKCIRYLGGLLNYEAESLYFSSIEVINDLHRFEIGGFSLEKQPNINSSLDWNSGYIFEAPTTKCNAMRVIRALQIQKPILIEGSPGVGKTTLVAAIALACNQPLIRINLSEQSDLMDLFGSDLPVEGEEVGKFAWRDAPFLQAMQKGEWVLLDEMNLASQSVLEGLNACLDHRGEVYISELNRTFKCHPNFFVFAAQNPHHQGGGRKGLPSSFVNRFTVVYADVFTNDDLNLICTQKFPTVSEEIINSIVSFVSRLHEELVVKQRFGSEGGPWELNLRDILRWLQLLSSDKPLLQVAHPSEFIDIIFRQRFRTMNDRLEVDKIRNEIFSLNKSFHHLFHNISSIGYQVGLAYLPRKLLAQNVNFPDADLTGHLSTIESVMICVQQNIPCLLVGPSGSGKSTILQHLAAVTGNQQVIFSLNSDTDIMDLIGGFEQVDPHRILYLFFEELELSLKHLALSSLPLQISPEVISLLERLDSQELPSGESLLVFSEKLLLLDSQTNIKEFGDFARRCHELSEMQSTVENIQFEWVDGILLKALVQGKWLVLDNANLCGPSVLDRLNSLLEPGGYLRINEHCNSDGEPRIIRPHPNFRIFLTIDPRFGELSRAMRNRTIEIYLELQTNSFCKSFLSARPESWMQRFGKLLQVMEQVKDNSLHLVYSVGLDNLSWSDMSILPRFISAFDQCHPKKLSSLCELYTSIHKDHTNRSVINMMARVNSFFEEQNFHTEKNQIIHPLQNSPMVPLVILHQKCEHIFWLGIVFEFILELGAARGAQYHQKASLKELKSSSMNKFQKSLIEKNTLTVKKDATTNIAEFLESTLKLLSDFLQSQLHYAESWAALKNTISSLLFFWWEIFHQVTSSNFSDEDFRAHLSIGRDLIHKIEKHDFSFTRGFRDIFDKNFSRGSNLITGQSMEVMWKKIRPEPIPNLDVFNTLIEMEGLALRFDALRWRNPNSISDLENIMKSFVDAYCQVLISKDNGTNLITSLTQEIKFLENEINKEEEVKPFFEQFFDIIRQYQILSEMQCGPNVAKIDFRTLVLSNQPTLLSLELCTATSSSRPFQIFNFLLGTNSELSAVRNVFCPLLIEKIKTIYQVRLNSLRLLEYELPILGQNLSLLTSTLPQNQILNLNKILIGLIDKVVEFHGDIALKFWKELCSIDITKFNMSLTENTINLHVVETLKNHFLLSFRLTKPTIDQTNLLRSSAQAWIEFAIGCIKLFVPDRLYDPDKRQRLELQQHATVKELWSQKLHSLRKFEHILTGQDTNLRCQILESDLEDLEEPGEILQDIYRPECSEMNCLQEEFENVLKIVLESNMTETINKVCQTKDGGSFKFVRLFLTNINQILLRLTSKFKAYRDLTRPVICMLRCLQIGLSLVNIEVSRSEVSNEKISDFEILIPFISTDGSAIQEGLIRDYPLVYLAIIATNAHVEGRSILQTDLRHKFLKTVHEQFDSWKTRLENDLLNSEFRSGLYRYRGSLEDETMIENEQFEELFPSSDKENSQKASNISISKIRETAVKFVIAHDEVFFGSGTSVDKVKSLMKSVSMCISSTLTDKGNYACESQTPALLPASILLLDDKINDYNEILNPASYNFYIDPNLPECRKLVFLIHKIQDHYRELQKVDEIGHMQCLQDVLNSCHELLHLCHTDPLAKIITKLEKVHAFMHEWEFGGWASKDRKCPKFFEDITAIIISWRQLELSTWAKLFDTELSKCEDDAKSWWFMAYQIAIAAPLQISESEDEMKDYTLKLLIELESYFSSAILGQFSQRLKLLKQLVKHIEILQLEVPSMSIILKALRNFTEFYLRYEKPVQEYLVKGRSSLDKMMRDVLLMASWKDTNILALRESSRRSHFKLFKIVKKYRLLLSQPMQNLLVQGLPDEQIEKADMIDKPLTFHATIDSSALEICESYVPKWSEKSKRFKNISQTINLMENAARLPPTMVDSSTHLEAFIKGIIDTSSELQKATPSFFSEQNKETISYLKTRKKKLFAAILKDLRLMGINYNLSSDNQRKQKSFSDILAQLDNWEHFKSERVEYYFHKSIDNILTARKSIKNHSQDLSNAEVTRSSGFLEGFLQIIISHHNYLSDLTSSLKIFDLNLKTIKNLCAHDYSIRSILNPTNQQKLLRWLPVILKVGLDLVEIHAKLGGVESEAIKANLQIWIDRFANLEEEWNYLPRLHPQLTTTKHLCLQNMISDAAHQLFIELTEIQKTRPDLEVILHSILPWTQIIVSSECSDSEKLYISDLDSNLSRLSDCVLVSIENYKKEVSCLPKSSDEQGWFVKSFTSAQRRLATLQIKVVSCQIEKSFAILAKLNLEEEQTSQTASACFAMVLPILEQYQFIFSEGLRQYKCAYRATCKTSYILAKYFIQIATKGFCTPSEKSDSKDKESQDLVGGTGLGDGEGDEDISRDVQDEDLDELAQESSLKKRNDIVDEEEAVDMADGELEGEFDESQNAEDTDNEFPEDEESKDQIDEEAASKNNLDPGAIDEKMWDGNNEETENNQLYENSKGKAKKDDLMAAKDEKNTISDNASVEDNGQQENEEAIGDEQEDEIIENDAKQNYSHIDEAETLELPDDMALDGIDQKSDSEDESPLDNLSATENTEQEDEMSIDGNQEIENENDIIDERENDSDIYSNPDINKNEDPDDKERKTQEAGERTETEEQVNGEEKDETLLQNHENDTSADSYETIFNDTQRGVSEGRDNSNHRNPGSLSRANQEDDIQNQGSIDEDGDGPTEQDQPANSNHSKNLGDKTESNSTDSKAFKKLGEILEEWHRRQAKNHDLSQQNQDLDANIDKDISELQHLQDENAIPDTQALGTATQDEACTLDESMALEMECDEFPDQFQPDEIKEQEISHSGIIEFDEPLSLKDQESNYNSKDDMGAIIGKTRDDDDTDYHNQAQRETIADEIDGIIEVDYQVKDTFIKTTGCVKLASKTQQIWSYYENLTHDLSLALTEQLRLILAPTLASKMRGDFRTGKRLNIKRIIPYIASQYKRDKIWMRRSKPSKRNYQVMLAIDDSKSMAESKCGSLTFETLVMISKSLSMLEVGEICIAGFGEDVNVAHKFETPFSSNAGPQILQCFDFQQNKTDIALLIRKSMEIFRSARAKANHVMSDIWQLELIISDGICESLDHDKIRRLIREAFEEKIMIVFVIMDAVKDKKGGQSVMELNQAMFVDGVAVTSRYLDSFPFQYYIVVREVRDLPNVLSTLIRQWFQETVGPSY